MLVVSLGSVVALTYVGLLSFSHANIYPSGADQVQAGNDGAPQSLGQGWTPPVSPTDASQGRTAIQGFPATSAAQLRSMVQTFNKLNVPGTGLDKQAAISYLQNLQRLQSRFKTLFAPPQPPNIPLPLPLRSSDLLPPAPSPPIIPTPPRLPTPPVRPPPLKAPMIPPWALQQNQPPPPPQLRPPQPKPLSPSALSPFVGPPPAGNKPAPAPPQRAQQYVPPPRAMAGGGECSGRFVPGQLCCDGIVNPLPAGGNQQWGCCHKGIYNINTQVCCGDVPVPKPTSGPPMLCCGMALYDPRTQLCCDKFPVPNQGGTLKCCRKQAYDPVNQMCCGESVKPRPPHQRNMDCCGKHMYNPMTHLCCEEGNTFLKNPMTQCCGKNTFMPTTQQCCFGDALPKGAMCMAK